MADLADGIRIVSVEGFGALPAVTAIWGDWGAEVIRIEPLAGDPTRDFGGFGIYPAGMKVPVFEFLNRNKRSVALNLKSQQGKKVLRKLMERADVFCTNFAPDTLPKIDADYETVSKVNPQIIYAAVNGYGDSGPDKDQSGFDTTAYWARSGSLMMMGEFGTAPVVPRPGMGDLNTAGYAAGAIAAALLCRHMTGIAQKVTVSLLGCGMWSSGFDLTAALSTGEDIPRTRREDTLNPLNLPYRTKDDKWLFLSMIQSSAFWPQTCNALGRQDLIEDPRFANAGLRAANGRVLVGIFEDVFAARTREEWTALLRREGVVFGLAQSCLEVINDPQANEYIATVEHPTRGKVRVVKSPGQFSKTPSRIRGYGLGLGEHTAEVLLELGYSRDEIAKLRDERVVL